MHLIRPLILVLLLSSLHPSLRAEGNKLDFQPADTVQTVLERQVGQTVELRLKAGEKIGGKVEKVGAKLVQLSQLTGAEFSDAVVDLESISAVVVRTRTK